MGAGSEGAGRQEELGAVGGPHMLVPEKLPHSPPGRRSAPGGGTGRLRRWQTELAWHMHKYMGTGGTGTRSRVCLSKKVPVEVQP